ncbi:MAG: hypothetical protein ACOYJD_00685 [Christensenellales bacterium]|jgi:hypothetical protein
MRGKSLFVFVWLMLILLIFSGCGKQNTDKTLISIISNGDTTLPYTRFSWDSSITESGWIQADALQLIYELPNISDELPIVTYNNDFSVLYQKNVSFSHMLVYDDSFKQLHHIASYDDMDYLDCIHKLEQGSFYINIMIAQRGEYISSVNEYEYSGIDCIFKLVVN